MSQAVFRISREPKYSIKSQKFQFEAKQKILMDYAIHFKFVALKFYCMSTIVSLVSIFLGATSETMLMLE